MNDPIGLIKETFSRWSTDKCSRLGAALAYYALFSIAPLLIIVLGVASHLFGHEAPRTLMLQIQQFVGPTAAEAIAGMIKATHQNGNGLLPTVLGAVTMLIGAAGLFVGLQDALNTIWGVAPDPRAGWGIIIRNRLVSFVMVLLCSLVLLASLIASAVIEAFSNSVDWLMPMPPWMMEGINVVVSLVMITVVFAMMYRVLPDVDIAWGDVWMGAAFTALLFTLGKVGLGIYLGRSSVASAYGAAGSLVVLLIWVYYAAQIFLFGAEYTQVYANKYGSHFKTSEHAIPLAPEALAEEGIAPQPVYEAASNEMARKRGTGDVKGRRGPLMRKPGIV